MKTLFKITIYSKVNFSDIVNFVSHKIVYSRERGHLTTCDTHTLPAELFDSYVRKKMRRIKVGKYAILSKKRWISEYE